MDINCSNRNLFLQSLEDFSNIDFNKYTYSLEEDLENNALHFSIEERTGDIFTKTVFSTDLEKTFTRFLEKNHHIMESSAYKNLDDKKETMERLKLVHEKFKEIFGEESPVVEGIKLLGRTALESGLNSYKVDRCSLIDVNPKITSFAPSEAVVLLRDLESSLKEEDSVEESKLRSEKIETSRAALLTSIVHAINVDQIPLKEFGFTSIEECLEILHELVDSGYSLEHLDFYRVSGYRVVFSEDRYQQLLDLLDKLSKPSSLKTLNLYNWNISSSINCLFPYLEKFTHLTTLNLGGNRLGDTGVDIEALASRLNHLTDLKILNLGLNSLDATDIRALAPVLESLNKLQTIHLESNNLGFYGIRALASALEHLVDLKKLYLGSNNLGANSIKVLAPVLKLLTDLETLCLEGNHLGDDHAAGMRALAPALESLSKLKTLDLRWNNLGDDRAAGMRVLAPVLKSLNKLKTLDLGSNNLGRGVRFLASVLNFLTGLRTLSLERNQLSEAHSYDIEALASGLKCLTHLKTLNIGLNRLGAGGMRILTPALEHFTDLQILNLQEKSIWR